MKPQPHVLIIGGGIAGPVLALFLKKAGISCAIYEAHAPCDEVGGALTVAPNGMNVLEQLGLAERLAEAGSVITEFAFRTHRGKALATMRDTMASRSGRPAVSLSRARLLAIILGEVQRQGIAIEHGRRLQHFNDDGRSVTAHFEDGTRATGDVLVGADGIHSRVRSLLLPHGPKPSYTGLMGTGGFLPRSAIPQSGAGGAQTMTFCFGPGVFFGYACGNNTTGEDGAYWWSAFDRPQPLTQEQRAALQGRQGIEALLAEGDGWFDAVQHILRSSSKTIAPLELYDVQSLPHWWRGRVVLMGDAAHAVSPHSGQGASMAIEDAIVLARQLRDHGSDLGLALAGFEQLRRERTERVIAFGRRSGDSKKRRGPLATWLQQRLMALFVKYGRPPLWIYQHRESW